MTGPPALAGNRGRVSVWKVGQHEGTPAPVASSRTVPAALPPRLAAPWGGPDRGGCWYSSRSGAVAYSVAFSQLVGGTVPGLFCGGSMCRDSRPVPVRCAGCRGGRSGVPRGCGSREQLGSSWLSWLSASSPRSASSVAGSSSVSCSEASDGRHPAGPDVRGARGLRRRNPAVTVPSGICEGVNN